MTKQKGTHIDGFIAVVGHTIVAGASSENKVTGRKADVILAAYYASQAALKLLKPKTENYTITDVVSKMAKEYNCKPVEGMLSHELTQFKIDGKKTIIQNPTEAQKKEHEKCEIEEYEVYALDVLISTGNGTAREMDARVSIYKKTDEVYQLKLKTSKKFYAEAVKRFGSMPFNLRSFEDEKNAKMGVVECVSHKLLNPFQVLFEKQGEYVAQFKITVLIFPSGPSKITGLTLDESLYESEYSIHDTELKVIMNSSLKVKATKKKKKPKQNKNSAVTDGSEKMQVTEEEPSNNNHVEKMDVDS